MTDRRDSKHEGKTKYGKEGQLKKGNRVVRGRAGQFGVEKGKAGQIRSVASRMETRSAQVTGYWSQVRLNWGSGKKREKYI